MLDPMSRMTEQWLLNEGAGEKYRLEHEQRADDTQSTDTGI